MSLILFLVAAASMGSAPAAPNLSPEVMAAAAALKNDGPALIARLEALWAAGDASANELLGELLLLGNYAGIKTDPARACGYFERTADRRGDSAQNLATCYYSGNGRGRDWPRARVLYRRAMELGWPSSGCALGNMLIAGQGGPVDVATGIASCRTAALAGDADAQTDLGNYLLQGIVVHRDITAARGWYERVALHDQPNAAFVLGQIHWNGDGTPVNRLEAVRLWRIAYAKGRKDAAALIARAMIARLLPEAKSKKALDPALLAETRLWIGRAAAEDPDPAKRTEFGKLLADLPAGG